MVDNQDARTADAFAAGVVSGGVMLAILGAIIVAIVLHPALANTLAAGGAVLSVAWLALAPICAAIKGAFSWIGSRVSVDLSRAYDDHLSQG
jgi:hypothetical protein